MSARLQSTPARDLSPGDEARLTRTLTAADIALFAAATGDVNPAHLDPAYANDTLFHGVIAHGLWGAGLISALLGVKLPGPGTIYLSQTLSFRRPVKPGQTVEACVRVKSVDAASRRVVFDCEVAADGKAAITGEAEVLAPGDALSLPEPLRPDARLHERPERLAAFALADGPDAPESGETQGAAWLVDAPAAPGLLLFVCGPQAAWEPLARAAGLDPLRAADASPDALAACAREDGPQVIRCAEAAIAHLLAETLDQLGGAAASAFRLTSAGAAALPGDDPEGVETAAARALARLSRLETAS